MKIEPMADRLIVQRTDATERQSEGGIVIPSQAQKRSNTGRIISLGDDITQLQVGQVVLLSDTAGVPFQHEGEDYLVIRVGEILAKLV